MKTRRIAVLAGITAALAVSMARAQGSLAPPGAPDPTMKTLQELWDKIAVQQTALANLSRQNSLLLAANGVTLPWNFMNAPSPSGALDLAFDADGRATVAYIEPVGAIRLARFNGAAWSGEEAAPDSTGLYGISLAFAPDGTPAMAFQANALGGSEIGYAYYDGSTWQIETVDARNPADSSCTLAFGPDGRPAIAHCVEANTNLVFSTRVGTAWSNATVDAGGLANSLAFDPDGQPCLAYSRSDGLYFARYDGTNWNKTPLDGQIPVECALGFGSDRQPVILYNIYGSELKYAYYDGAAWNTSTLDSNTGSDYFAYISLAFGPEGQPACVYARGDVLTGTHSLKFIRYIGSVSPETIDSTGDTGYYASLAFGADGQPAIAYNRYFSDQYLTQMKYLFKGAFSPP